MEVLEAYKRIKANRGSAGVDKQSLEEFEVNLKGNLYKVWNRMSSGSYLPPPVREVEIPKKSGGVRPLGIPTVADRIAQSVVAKRLEAKVEPVFHPDSYAYRPGRSALDAVGKTRERCWRFNWVIDLDIRAFFDSLDWELLLKAVRAHVKEKWVLLYIERWLKAPVMKSDGSLVARQSGTPQGGVVSPMLANLFLHYAFDRWMARGFPRILFARYADDIVVHCESKEQAEQMLGAIRARLKECRLELSEEKTRIVYCKDSSRKGEHEQITFDFLGYTFQPRFALSRTGRYFVGYLPAVSNASAKRIRQTVREWRLGASHNHQTLDVVLTRIEPQVRGWVNYFGRYYRTKSIQVLQHVQRALIQWAMKKFKGFRRRERAAGEFLKSLSIRHLGLARLYQLLGVRTTAGKRRAV